MHDSRGKASSGGHCSTRVPFKQCRGSYALQLVSALWQRRAEDGGDEAEVRAEVLERLFELKARFGSSAIGSVIALWPSHSFPPGISKELLTDEEADQIIEGWQSTIASRLDRKSEA